MKVWTLEQIARSLGCSVQQMHRLCVLDKLPSYKDSNDGLKSIYSYRVKEADLLAFFNCETVEQFKQLRYR
jgi:hypothetical protein